MGPQTVACRRCSPSRTRPPTRTTGGGQVAVEISGRQSHSLRVVPHAYARDSQRILDSLPPHSRVGLDPELESPRYLIHRMRELNSHPQKLSTSMLDTKTCSFDGHDGCGKGTTVSLAFFIRGETPVTVSVEHTPLNEVEK